MPYFSEKKVAHQANVIQDSLGHTTEAMTQVSLNSFETQYHWRFWQQNNVAKNR